ncbi:hypothetical protein HHI36_017305 [Cryptolaemus montrouzieri]|uniref:Endonuclease/exonuclease/phosphatase domain-containing protein n=1 Tax=Cryptolaemus montrouzieri TaxID=559131 RepID=A0ABD2NMY2_9CUCU
MCVLFPPDIKSNDFLTYLDQVTSFMDLRPADMFVFVGDFNLNEFDWYQDGSDSDLKPSVLSEDPYTDFTDFCAYNSMFQFNGVRNHNGKVLDLVLSNVNSISVHRSDLPYVRKIVTTGDQHQM